MSGISKVFVGEVVEEGKHQKIISEWNKSQHTFENYTTVWNEGDGHLSVMTAIAIVLLMFSCKL